MQKVQRVVRKGVAVLMSMAMVLAYTTALQAGAAWAAESDDDLTVEIKAGGALANGLPYKSDGYKAVIEGSADTEYTAAWWAEQVTVTDSTKTGEDKTLTPGTDYTVVNVSSNSAGATAGNIVIKVGDNIFESVKFAVNRLVVASASLKTSTYTYSGNEITDYVPEFKDANDKDISSELVKDTNYSVSLASYKNTSDVETSNPARVLDAGEYTVRFTNTTKNVMAFGAAGDGEKDYLETKLKVEQADISNAAVTLDKGTDTNDFTANADGSYSVEYNGAEQKPTVGVTYGSATHTENTDFTWAVSSESPKDVGTYTVTVTGKGNNFTSGSTKAVTYKIGAKSIANAVVTLEGNTGADGTTSSFKATDGDAKAYSVTYNGKAQKPSVQSVVVDNITVDSDSYKVSYSDNTNVGTAKVSVTAKDNTNFTGTAEQTFTINAASIAKAAVAFAGVKTDSGDSIPYVCYNGKEQKLAPTVNITLDGNELGSLKEGTDYTLSYKNITSGGSMDDLTGKADADQTIEVTITGKGNYAGSSKRATYKIAQAAAIVTPAGEDATPTGYATLAEALSNVNASGTVTLQNDYSGSVTINNGKVFTLDLGGKTLTVTGSAFTISGSGTNVAIKNGAITSSVDDVITVEGSAAVTLGSDLTITCSSSVLYAHGGGQITVDGAVVSSSSTAYAGAYVEGASSGIVLETGKIVNTANAEPVALSVGPSGTFTMTGGELRSDYSTALAVGKGGTTSATATVSGGTITTGAQVPAYVAAYTRVNSTFTMSGGTITSEHTPALSVLGGTTTISGGTLTSGSPGFTVGAYESAQAKLVVKDNAVITNTSSGAAVQSGRSDCPPAASGTVEIQGGTITSTSGKAVTTVNAPAANMKVSGGTFNTNVPDEYLVDGYVIEATTTENEDGTTSVTYAAEQGRKVAKVGGYSYSTLKNALGAITGKLVDSTEIQLIADVNATGEDLVVGENGTIAKTDDKGIAISSGMDIMLDLNGKTLSLGLNSIRVSDSGKLTVKDSAAVDANGDPVTPTVNSDYSVSYTAGTITATNAAIVTTGGGSFKLESGTVESKKFSAVYAGVDDTDGTVEVTGGYIAAQECGITVWHNSTLTFSGGVVSTVDNSAISGNGSKGYLGNTTITISGGTLIGNITSTGYASCGIYHPQSGTLTITGGKIVSTDGAGVLMRAGTLNMTDGEIVALSKTEDTKGVKGKVGDSEVTVTKSGIIDDREAGYPGAASGDKTKVSGGTVTGKYAALDALPADKSKTTFEVSGGNFSSALAYEFCAEGKIPNYTQGDDGYYHAQEQEGTVVAEVVDGKPETVDKVYDTLNEALTQAKNGDTVVVLADTSLSDTYAVDSNKTVTIDLGGKTVTINRVNIKHGGLVIKNGTINGSGKSVGFGLYGSTDSTTSKYSTLDIQSDVKITNVCYAVGVMPNGNSAYGVEVNIDGDAEVYWGLAYVNGTVNKTEGNVPKITIGADSVTTSKGQDQYTGVGIYAAGYAEWEIAGTITAEKGDALSIKSGSFKITGGTYTSNGAFANPAASNSNSSEDTGAALSITSNDSYAKKISIEVTGGTFTSANGYALYEGIAQKGGTDAAAASYVAISVKGGTFNGSSTSTSITSAVAITKAVNKAVVSGGTFNKELAYEYCVSSFMPTYNDESKTYGVTEDSTAIAQVKGDTSKATDRVYTSLADAVAAAESATPVEGGVVTVTLLHDVKLAQTQTIPKTLVLDLNGHEVTEAVEDSALGAGDNTSLISVASGASLTVQDSSEEHTGSIVAATANLPVFANRGALTVTGGTFTATGTGSYVVSNNGTFTTSVADVTPYFAGSGAGVLLNNGTATVENGVFAYGTLGAAGGTITAADGSVVVSGVGSTLEINDATATQTITDESGEEVTTTSTYPEFINSAEGETALFTGPKSVAEDATAPTVTVKGGLFSGALPVEPKELANCTVTVKGGLWTTSNFNKYVVAGKGASNEPATVTDVTPKGFTAPTAGFYKVVASLKDAEFIGLITEGIGYNGETIATKLAGTTAEAKAAIDALLGVYDTKEHADEAASDTSGSAVGKLKYGEDYTVTKVAYGNDESDVVTLDASKDKAGDTGGKLVNAGTYTLTIKGIGNCQGFTTCTFKITPQDISQYAAVVTAGNGANAVALSGDDAKSVVYNGKSWQLASSDDADKMDAGINRLALKVYKDPAKTDELVQTEGTGDDVLTNYDVIYNANTNAGTADVVVIGRGNYTGAIPTSFTIEKRDIGAKQESETLTGNGVTVTYAGGAGADSLSYSYTGEAIVPQFKVTSNDGTSETVYIDTIDGDKTTPVLVSGTDYKFEYYKYDEDTSAYGTTALSEAKELGTYKLKVVPTDNGNITGGIELVFKIAQAKKDITAAVADLDYNGTEQTPNVTVTDTAGDSALTLSSGDYDVAFAKLSGKGDTTVTEGTLTTVKDAGYYRAFVTLKGNYSGTATADFRINVASIGDAKYTSLAEAVAAVPANGAQTTIKLVSFQTTENAAGAIAGSGVKVASGKNIVFDLNGMTYEVGKPLVGSTGTETNGFQLLKDSTVAFRNGTVSSSNAYILIQNYSNLTLESVKLDGTHLKGGYYALSLNNGDVKIGDSTQIIAPSGGYAFDVCWADTQYPKGVHVTVEGENIEINGKVQFGQWNSKTAKPAESTLNVKSGTFKGDFEFATKLYDAEDIAIEDGTFEGAFTYSSSVSKDADEKWLTISGGTFKQDPSQTVSADYPAASAPVAQGDGTYGIAKTLAASDVEVAVPDDLVYTGNAIEPSVTVSYESDGGDTAVVAPDSYNVTYSVEEGQTGVLSGSGDTAKPLGAGTYTVTVKATSGIFSGTQTAKEFGVAVADIASATLDGAADGVLAAKTYNGSEQTASITLKMGATTLTDTTDYVVTYTTGESADAVTPKDAGAYTAIIKPSEGNKNFGAESTKTASFTIEPASIAGTTVAGVASGVYTGAEQDLPALTVTDAAIADAAKQTLAAGSDYALAWRNAAGSEVAKVKDAGTYTATIAGAGNYGGSETTFAYTIAPKSIGGATVTVTGTSVGETLAVTVKDGESALQSGTDYTLAYTAVSSTASLGSDGKPFTAGNYTVTISGMGNYGASKVESFTMTAPVSDTAVTAVETLIGNLPGAVALSDADAVAAARSAYDKLSAAQKNQIGSPLYAKLVSAEGQIAKLQAAEDDADAAAQAVQDVIDTIDTLPAVITLETESAVTAAEKLYASLTSEQRALVTNYSTLTAARSALDTLKAQAAQANANVNAVEGFISAVAALGDVDGLGINDTEAVEYARAKYTVLTSSQKALFEGESDLAKRASTALDTLKAAEVQVAAMNADLQQTIEAATAAISAADAATKGVATSTDGSNVDVKSLWVSPSVSTELAEAYQALKDALAEIEEQQATGEPVTYIGTLPEGVTLPQGSNVKVLDTLVSALTGATGKVKSSATSGSKTVAGETVTTGTNEEAGSYTVVKPATTKASIGEVTYYHAPANVTTAKVASTVKIGGRTYKVTKLANNAFKGTKVTSVVIGDNITTIGSKVFSNAKTVTKVTIGKNVKKVGKKAFKSAKKVKTVVVKTAKLATKSAVKSFLKGSKIKRVQVKVASKAAKKKVVKAIKKWGGKKKGIKIK